MTSSLTDPAELQKLVGDIAEAIVNAAGDRVVQWWEAERYIQQAKAVAEMLAVNGWLRIDERSYQ